MGGETYTDSDNDVQKGVQNVKRQLAMQEATQGWTPVLISVSGSEWYEWPSNLL